MGGPRTEEPPRAQQATVADDISAETPPRHTASTDSARTKHRALTRRKYGFLVPAGTVFNPANVGYTGSKAGHGATADQDGREPEEERDEILQRALPAWQQQSRRRGKGTPRTVVHH